MKKMSYIALMNSWGGTIAPKILPTFHFFHWSDFWLSHIQMEWSQVYPLLLKWFLKGLSLFIKHNFKHLNLKVLEIIWAYLS